MKESEEIESINDNNNLINNEIIDPKYKLLFDKYKKEDDLISKNDLKEILNESGYQINLEQSEKLIKNINKNENDKLDLKNFAQIMENVNINDIPEKETLSNFKIVLTLILFIFGGIILNLSSKILRELKAYNLLFEHKHFMIFCMFLGEFICLIIDYIKELLCKKKNEEENEPKKHIKFWNFLLLAVLCIISNILKIFILAYLIESIYEMFNGLLIISTFIASILYLKNKYYRHHTLSICLIVLGMSLTGFYSNKAEGVNKNIGLGIVLIILEKIVIGIFFILEEKILKNYNYNSLKLVGLEGMWGLIIYFVLLILFQLISCNNWKDFNRENFCTENENHNYHIEDSLFAFRQLKERKVILLTIFGFLIGVILYNFSRLIIFKNRSSIFCLIINSLSNFIGYIVVGLVIKTLNLGNSNELFSWLIFIGFPILLLGCLIYFEILIIPFCGFGDNTKKTFKKKKQLEKDISLLNINISNDV